MACDADVSSLLRSEESPSRCAESTQTTRTRLIAERHGGRRAHRERDRHARREIGVEPREPPRREARRRHAQPLARERVELARVVVVAAVVVVAVVVVVGSSSSSASTRSRVGPFVPRERWRRTARTRVHMGARERARERERERESERERENERERERASEPARERERESERARAPPSAMLHLAKGDVLDPRLRAEVALDLGLERLAFVPCCVAACAQAPVHWTMFAVV